MQKFNTHVLRGRINSYKSNIRNDLNSHVEDRIKEMRE